MIEYGWHNLAGNVGVAAIIGSYLGLQLGKVDGRGLAYSVANAACAVLVLASLWVDFNLSALEIESFWVGISLIGVVRGVRGRAVNGRAE